VTHGRDRWPLTPARTRRAGRPPVPVSRRVGTGLAALAGSGLLSLVLYASRCAEPVSVIGAGLLITGAVSAAGGALGFLFGIPRAIASHAEESPASAVSPRPVYVANTNLEQVSDWLTKLLIGAGLTQLGSLGGQFRRLVLGLAPTLGDRHDSAVFAAALVTEFLVLSFLGGWLSTRLLLASALSEADRRALDTFVQAENLSGRGDHAEADDLRARAMDELGLPRIEADRYDDMRRRLPQGSSRTAQMQALVDAARASAPDTALDPAHVREFFESGGEGRRIYALALMQGDPGLADLGIVLEAIEQSRSAFEQYQALVLAELVAPGLTAADRDRLCSTLASQLASGGRLTRSSSRRHVAERVLGLLQDRSDSGGGTA
jgi:hypothetical protein